MDKALWWGLRFDAGGGHGRRRGPTKSESCLSWTYRGEPKRSVMAGTTWKKFTAAFKAQVPGAALKDDKAVPEIAQTYGIHPTKVTRWKGYFENGTADAFESKKRQGES